VRGTERMLYELQNFQVERLMRDIAENRCGAKGRPTAFLSREQVRRKVRPLMKEDGDRAPRKADAINLFAFVELGFKAR
jgi:hypothetical protein